MKKPIPPAVIAGIFICIVLNFSCSKSEDTTTQPKEQLVQGHWNINRVQLRLYQGGTFVKDTIIHQTPMPENYVQFGAAGNFEYRFNKPGSDVGTYQFVGADSVISNVTSKIYRWKLLTLTNVLFTVMNTSTDPDHPGATVETYQTFVK